MRFKIPLILVIVTISMITLVSAGFLSTTIIRNPSGWEDNGSVLRQLTDNPVNISGNVSIGGGFSEGGIDLTTLGDISLAGDILIQGDILTITDQEINGSFLPTDDDRFNLGSTLKRWKDIFFTGTITGSLFSGNNSQWSKVGTNVFLTTSTDKVGIGTVSPTNTLHVNSTASKVVKIESDGANLASSGAGILDLAVQGDRTIDIGPHISFALQRNNPAGTLEDMGIIGIFASDSTDGSRNSYMGFWTRATSMLERMRITNLGNVGIGTSVPTEKLVVAGNANVTGNLIVGADGSGKVGIGTTTPAELLHISGTDGQAIIESSSAAARLYLNFTGSIPSSFSIRADTVSGTPTFIIRNDSSSDDLFAIDSSGNIGIGTTSPSTQLNMYRAGGTVFKIDSDSGNDVNVRFSEAGTDIWQVGYAAGANTFRIRDQPNTNEIITITDGALENALYITSTGVGIGNTVPNATLDVQGNTIFRGNITINDSVTDSAILIDSTNDAILFTGENGSLYQPVYGTDDDLVLYLPFELTNSSTQFDRSPYGNDGTLQNGVNCNVSLGKYGAACSFDNNTLDYITLGDNSLDVMGSDGTIELWIKLVSPSAGRNRNIFSYADSAQGNNYVAITIGTSNQISSSVRADAASSQWSFLTDEAIPANEWKHIAWVQREGIGITFYIDGVEKSGSLTETGAESKNTYFNNITSIAELTTIGSFRRNDTHLNIIRYII